MRRKRTAFLWPANNECTETSCQCAAVPLQHPKMTCHGTKQASWERIVSAMDTTHGLFSRSSEPAAESSGISSSNHCPSFGDPWTNHGESASENEARAMRFAPRPVQACRRPDLAQHDLRRLRKQSLDTCCKRPLRPVLPDGEVKSNDNTRKIPSGESRSLGCKPISGRFPPFHV